MNVDLDSVIHDVFPDVERRLGSIGGGATCPVCKKQRTLEVNFEDGRYKCSCGYKGRLMDGKSRN